MTPIEIAEFVATAAASGIIGNRMDAVAASLGPVQKLHAWLRVRLIDPAAVEPSPAIDSWVDLLGDADRKQLGDLLREAITSARSNSVQVSRGVAVGHNVFGDITNTVIETQNNYATSRLDGGWEYAKIHRGQEGDFDRGGMKWATYISWPGASRLDVRDHVLIQDVLNELGQDGWELVTEKPAMGINATEYTFRRQKRR